MNVMRAFSTITQSCSARRCGLLALLLCSFAALQPVHAGSPLVVDDASIVDPGTCQLETWLAFEPHRREAWFLPACNVGGNLELTFGARDANQTGATGVAWTAQAKTVFRPLQPDDWGIGVAVGTLQGRGGQAYTRNWYGYVPVSRSFRNDAFVLHVNLGWQGGQRSDASGATWGIGSETLLTSGSWLLAEISSEQHGATEYQIGIRHNLGSDRMQMFVAFADQLGSTPERRFSIGLRLQSKPHSR